MIINAYAKLNLYLGVSPKKEGDELHEIDIISVPLSLHDSIEIFEIPNKNETFLTSDDPTLICDENNLAYKALNIMKKHFADDMKRSYRIHIYKRIPSEAGLGGGSADAAAVMQFFCKLLKKDPKSQEMLDIALEIGSDVPYCLLNEPSRVRGLGQNVETLDITSSYYVLIVKPLRGLSTKAVYDEFDKEEVEVTCQIDQTIEALQNQNIPLRKIHLFNALEQPAITLLPDVKETLDLLHNSGIELYGMSGSGSACYALSSSKHELEVLKNSLDKDKYQVFLTEFLNHKELIKKMKKRK